MKEKKESSDWNIAATHWLTAGFAIPILLSLVIGIPVMLIFGQENILSTVVIDLVAGVIGYWFGVMYSARFLEKTYIIKDSQKIIKLATMYLVIIGGGFRLYKIAKGGASLDLLVDLGFFVAMVIIFYIASKKYIHNTQMNEISPVSNISTENAI